MIRIIVTYGLISGVIICLSLIGTILMDGDGHHGNVWLGYLIMLVALSSILVAVKQYRDRALGGVIKFTTGLALGLGIALIASVAYVLVWEAYLAMTNYAFMPAYAAQILETKRAAGVTGEAYATAVAEMANAVRMYENPLLRMPMTFVEIFPVGLLVAIVSAALLRNSKFLPARSRATAA